LLIKETSKVFPTWIKSAIPQHGKAKIDYSYLLNLSAGIVWIICRTVSLAERFDGLVQ
jgi:hypothetical protein